MSFFKTVLNTFVTGLAVTLSLSAAQAFAGCSQQQEQVIGRQVADTVASKLSPKVSHQSKRLIKVEECDAGTAVVVTHFTYNYLNDNNAYAVSGTARIVGDKVEISELDHPEKIYASIKTNYMED